MRAPERLETERLILRRPLPGDAKSIFDRYASGTGLAYETPTQAATGYVLASDAWGKGIATESLAALVKLCERLAPLRVHSVCHHEHRVSQRVLEKCSFLREPSPAPYAEFPNLASSGPHRVVCYARTFASGGGL
jgi:RimJ/RimL family protein N-acetyltransferase